MNSIPTHQRRRRAATSKRVQSVERALALLRAVAASSEPLPLAELAEGCGVNRQTAWRLLLTLEHGGFVERDTSGHRYVLGHEIHRLATIGGHDALIALARPYVDQLAHVVGEAAYLDVPTGRGLRVLYETQAPDRLLPSILGRELPVHCTAAGKVWLAHMEGPDREAYLRMPLERLTAHTVTDPIKIEKDLVDIRKRGYSVSRDEYEDGWTAIGAPAFDDRGKFVAAVTIWALTAHMPSKRIKELADTVVATGRAITDQLGKR